LHNLYFLDLITSPDSDSWFLHFIFKFFNFRIRNSSHFFAGF